MSKPENLCNEARSRECSRAVASNPKLHRDCITIARGHRDTNLCYTSITTQALRVPLRICCVASYRHFASQNSIDDLCSSFSLNCQPFLADFMCVVLFLCLSNELHIHNLNSCVFDVESSSLTAICSEFSTAAPTEIVDSEISA